MRFKVVPCNHYEDVAFYRNHYKLISFPCGKCADCTKSRQNDIAVRAGYECMKYSDISFCRLSYRNDTLPLSYVPYLVFPDGSKIQDGRASLLEGDFLRAMRAQMASVPNSVIPGKSRYIHYDVPGMDFGDYRAQYIITPSVDLRDPRLWLKGCRVAFERQFGYKLPDFKYLMCAEYGSKYTRPHYHYLFLGLKPWIVDWMLERWEVRYGFTTRKTVRNSSKDKFRVSAYISKYMSKGDFDCPAVKSGIALKGRYCASRYLGREFIDGKRSHFLAFDVFGPYDPDRLVFSDGTPLSSSQIKTISNMIIQRMSIQVPGFDFRFALPRSWKYLLFYNKVPCKSPVIHKIPADQIDKTYSIYYTFTDSFRYVPFKIFRFVQKTLLDRAVSDDLRECRKIIMSLPSGTSVVEANFRLNNYRSLHRKNAEANSLESLESFYAKDSQ